MPRPLNRLALAFPCLLVVLRYFIINYTGGDVPLLLASCDASAKTEMALFHHGTTLNLDHSDPDSKARSSPSPPKEYVVLITGASRGGVGEALAKQYALRNATLILTARREKELMETAKACEAMGARRVFVLAGDISSRGETRRISNFIEEKFPTGGLNVAVVNHALIPTRLFHDIKSEEALEEEYFKTLDVNVKASISLVRRLLPLLERGTRASGRISSLMGIGTMGTYMGGAVIYLGAYLTSKTALQAFFDSLRTEREILGQDSLVAVQFAVLNEIASTIYLESKYGVKAVDRISSANKGELHWFARRFGEVYAALQPAPIPLEECAIAIACRVDRRLSNSFVPTYGEFPFRSIGKKGWTGWITDGGFIFLRSE